MRRLAMVVAGATASVLAAGAALAADVGPISLPATPPAVPLPSPPGFSFAGPYVGAYGGSVLGEFLQAGIQGGFNFVRGPILIGAEAQVGAAFGGGLAFDGALNARLGAVLGERILVYGEGGIEFVGGFVYGVGGGVEIGIGQSISVFVEAKALGVLGAPISAIGVQGGINWHPNY
ncbi:MAG: hypothetical protein ACWA6X_12555 [Bauldia sp.]